MLKIEPGTKEIKRTPALHLKFRAGMEERLELCQLEAGNILTVVGRWLTLPSVTTVELNGTRMQSLRRI